jgi:transposase
MPAGRVSMRYMREILRLGSAGISKHEIARRTGLAPSTVRETLKRFAVAGLVWPLPDDVTDATLEARLYKNVGTKQGYRRQVEPDWAGIHRELKRKHVTLSILWDEYIERHPDGYRYSRFCDLYRSFEGKLSITMRQAHPGGERLFVDYAGDRAPVVIDRLTGEIREAWIFVAVLGASNFTYAEATWTQGLADWIGAHTRALEAIGGVPRLIVPDNTKTAVIKACLYEPSVNRTYTEMAAHYDTAILPTRPRRLNEERPIRRLGVTRRQLLEELDRPMLKPLPVEPYVFAEWHLRRVGIDYHVDVERHYYSVPHRFAKDAVEVRLTARTVEVFAKGERIAAHLRSSGNGKHTTVRDHMPSSHRRYADWTIERIRRDAAVIGPSTAALCDLILEERSHPEQGFRACLGIVRLVKAFGPLRVEAAAARALDIGARTYGSVRSILDNNLDRHAAPHRGPDSVAILHRNIRGRDYYH